MANEEHLAILRQGVAVWNKWREANPGVEADLSGANFIGAIFNRANLTGANLRKVDLSATILTGADLTGADLSGAYLQQADLSEADFRNADLRTAVLRNADLRNADLRDAVLRDAVLSEADLTGASLSRADLTGAAMGNTDFGDNDLHDVIGLDTVRHFGPSILGTSTLYRSSGKIPVSFLRGCGVPESLIEYLPSLIGAMQPIQFYSCFISHSSKNHDFAQRLHSKMRDNNLRVWFAPEDMKGGQKLHEQIDQAIRVHDKLVLVLSEESISSPWVETEIRKARKAELRDNRRKLFPIRLVDFDTLRDWECFDADTGKDLAVEVREYFIPDFTRWKDHDAFEHAFARFLKDLQATETPPIPRAAPSIEPTTSAKDRPQNSQTIIATKKRRLALLEQQQATKGHSTPPEIIMEIEDLRREIGELEGSL